MAGYRRGVGIMLLGMATAVSGLVLGCGMGSSAAAGETRAEKAAGQARQEAEADKNTMARYQEYRQRLEGIEYREDIEAGGFRIVEEQVFPVTMLQYGEVSVMPALDDDYDRLALFFVSAEGRVVCKTDELEANSRNRGELKQPNRGIAAVSFQDLDRDGRMDIVLITTCVNSAGDYAGRAYKVGDVLFQNKRGDGFYRDYRISDKINRFSMNKSVEFITAFVRGGQSTEFLYTAATLEELLENGLQIIQEQCYSREFETLGKLKVVPGTYRVADYDIFLVYLVNEQGYIVSSLQPMGDFDNLYALKGINCRDIDGDGLKDIVVLARYSYEGSGHELIVKSDYAVYYQRTGGFSVDREIKESYQCREDDTMEELVERARAYWGWKSEK